MTSRPPLGFRMLLSLLAFAIRPALAQPDAPSPEQVPVPVANLTVFVDPPTGFVFVKLPSGWKFVGTVDRATLDQLPRHVATSLLVADAAAPAGACPRPQPVSDRRAGGRGPAPHAREAHPHRRRAVVARTVPTVPAPPSAAETPPESQPATF